MSRVLCGRCYGNGSTPMGACGVCGGTGNAADRACHNCGAPGRGTFCCGECFVEHCAASVAAPATRRSVRDAVTVRYTDADGNDLMPLLRAELASS